MHHLLCSVHFSVVRLPHNKNKYGFLSLLCNMILFCVPSLSWTAVICWPHESTFDERAPSAIHSNTTLGADYWQSLWSSHRTCPHVDTVVLLKDEEIQSVQRQLEPGGHLLFVPCLRFNLDLRMSGWEWIKVAIKRKQCLNHFSDKM